MEVNRRVTTRCSIHLITGAVKTHAGFLFSSGQPMARGETV